MAEVIIMMRKVVTILLLLDVFLIGVLVIKQSPQGLLSSLRYFKISSLIATVFSPFAIVAGVLPSLSFEVLKGRYLPQ